MAPTGREPAASTSGCPSLQAHLSRQVRPGLGVSSSPTHFAPTCPVGREGICTPDTSLEEETQPLVDCVNSTRPPACAKTITNTGIRFRRVGMGTLMGHVQFFGSPSTPTVAKPYHHPPTCSTRPIRQMLHTHWSLASWVSLSQALAFSLAWSLSPPPSFSSLSYCIPLRPCVQCSASSTRCPPGCFPQLPSSLSSRSQPHPRSSFAVRLVVVDQGLPGLALSFRCPCDRPLQPSSHPSSCRSICLIRRQK